jgi:hypothetical protein
MTTPAAANEAKKRKDAQAALREAVQQAVQTEIKTEAFQEAIRQVVRQEVAQVHQEAVQKFAEILTSLEGLVESSKVQDVTNEDLRDQLAGIQRSLELLLQRSPQREHEEEKQQPGSAICLDVQPESVIQRSGITYHYQQQQGQAQQGQPDDPLAGYEGTIEVDDYDPTRGRRPPQKQRGPGYIDLGLPRWLQQQRGGRGSDE